MFWNSKSDAEILLEAEILQGIRKLKISDVGTAEYRRTLDHLSMLYEMKEEEKSKSVSKDTAAVVAANLAGIFMIIKHEHVNVISTAAWNLLLKPFIRA
jgi:hypothetical protein